MFMAFLAQSVFRSRWTCLGYCLMTNHFHVVLSLSAANLSKGMHRLNGTYARRFNERHGYHGHLFDARFSSTIIKSEERNAMAAGLVNDPADWPWGSFRATAGLEPCPRFLAAARVRRQFGRGQQGAELYAAFVRARVSLVTPA